jgi:uncharacterized protein YegL
MGWAKYMEDNVSRHNGTSRVQAEIKKATGPLESSVVPPTPKVREDVRVATPARPKKQEGTMSKLKNFTASTARPLPVLVLADTSGSMSADGKIDALNTALKDMVDGFAEEQDGRAQLQVAIITFGDTAAVHHPLGEATKVALQPLAAAGMTPMGGAFDLARALIEDKEQIPSRAYTPAIVLVSDGRPNDAWEPALQRLFGSERARKAQRFALGIGADADATVLRRFLDNPEGTVYAAHDARQIRSFFRWVTMSVTQRSRSAQPNVSVIDDFPPSDLDELL